MKTEVVGTKKRRSAKKTLLRIIAVFFILLAIASVFLYYNFNRLLTAALMRNFNSNIASDVYELKFEKLSVNFLLGNINVHNVELHPREKPLHSYPYINSSFRLKTKKLALKSVELFTLLKSNLLRVDRIEIIEPDVELILDGDNHILLPFRDTGKLADHTKEKKKGIESFSMQKFEMESASFHVINKAKQRDFRIQKLDISLNDLMIDQQPGKDRVSYKHIDITLGEFTGHLQGKAVKHINFKDFRLSIDSLEVQQSPDTTIFHFADLTTGIKNLNIQTADSIFQLTMGSFNLSYKDRSIKLSGLSFKPNISNAALQRMSAYQKAELSGTIGSVSLSGVNFNSLVYYRSIFVEEVAVDKISLTIFKDKRKPVDKNRFPEYLAQKVKAVPLPLLIKHVKATNANLASTELKPDGTFGKANINRGTLDATNITNLSPAGTLAIKADAYIENKVHAHLDLSFHYMSPKVSFNGRVEKFNFTDLNPLLLSFTPASVRKGTVDEITFSGNATRTNATGTLKFLYHDLEVNLQLHEQAKWKSAVLGFAANTYLNASNPVSPNMPPRTGPFRTERDMNKGFINLLIKSVLSGLKETIILSKENKKAYREAKKEARHKAKKERKK